ncbi:hypothetical protein J6590_019978 [Homalodisca vitripennis]|nr:hypothetical protein J6590_027794 [Homalodisca vitripennis]KAG8337571.1 hypothetical protein J6590_019978 [Homalodisca vitripennis]
MPIETFQFNRKWLNITPSVDSKSCWRGRERQRRCFSGTRYYALSINHLAHSLTLLSRHRSRQAITGKKWVKLIDSNIPRMLPRSVVVADFRTTTGHDYLGAHLHRIRMIVAHLPRSSALAANLTDDDEDKLQGDHLPILVSVPPAREAV